MSTKGRKPLSTAEKKLKGTLQKCRENPDAPKVTTSAAYKPVAKLDTLAKKIWTRTVQFLKENELMGDVDVDMLTAYCMEMSKYVEHTRTAQQMEKDNAIAIAELEAMDINILSKIDAINSLPRPDRWYRMATMAFEKALKISDRYGFTPATRQKLKIEKGDEAPDALSAFFNPMFRSQIEAKA